MKTYKVIALSVGGKGNKIYHSGDKVKESNFPEGNAADLVKQGFLTELPDEETADEISTSDESIENKSSSEEKSKSFVNDENQTIVVKTIDDINKRQLIAELKKANVEFDSNQDKKTLFPIWFNL